MNLRSWLLLPARLWASLFIAGPMLVVLACAFLTHGDYGGVELPWTAENFVRLMDPLYGAIFWRSLWISGAATLLCALLGYPLALFIARSRRRNLYLQLVLLPFWISFLVRTYAWLFILRETGLANSVLLSLHVISKPLQLLYNDGAVLLGLVYNFLPLFVLPAYSALERLDRAVVEAAADLGAPPWRVFFRVIVPMSAPGVFAGAILVFIPSLGAFLTPDLLGGGKTVMIGNVIQNQFTTGHDWALGSALSIALMAITAVLLAAMSRSRAARQNL